MAASGMEPGTADSRFLGDVGTCGAPWRVQARGLGTGNTGLAKEDLPCRLLETEEVHLLTLPLTSMTSLL